MDNRRRVVVFHSNNVTKFPSSLLIHRHYPKDSSWLLCRYDEIQTLFRPNHRVPPTFTRDSRKGHTHASSESNLTIVCRRCRTSISGSSTSNTSSQLSCGVSCPSLVKPRRVEDIMDPYSSIVQYSRNLLNCSNATARSELSRVCNALTQAFQCRCDWVISVIVPGVETVCGCLVRKVKRRIYVNLPQLSSPSYWRTAFKVKSRKIPLFS